MSLVTSDACFFSSDFLETHDLCIVLLMGTGQRDSHEVEIIYTPNNKK